ncbi:MAG TPA: OmpH family outer membrane protein [Candidatus Angelobacter sp.]|jgi:outer membrane protein|nr:OmpH family outer membrane protein [Candidatus Angelobacter sp.]
MKRTLASIFLLVLVSMAALAQTTPAAPPVNPLANATGTKVAVIDMQGAIAGSNEGQRDFEALAKKFEPRRVELQKLNTDIEEAKKQLNVQGDKMSPDAHETLVKSIETKTKSLQRSAEDAQNEFQQQQNEIAQRILQKMAPVITKYVAENNYGLVIDASAPWPQGPVVLAAPSMDITKNVVDAYNAQSGVAAPARTGGATGVKPAGTMPGTARPATTPAKPATTTPPKQ